MIASVGLTRVGRVALFDADVAGGVQDCLAHGHFSSWRVSKACLAALMADIALGHPA